MRLCDQIRTRREQLGISVKELASKIVTSRTDPVTKLPPIDPATGKPRTVSDQAVRNWEADYCYPSKSQAAQLEHALQFKLDWTEGQGLPAGSTPNPQTLVSQADIDFMLMYSRLPNTAKAAVITLVRSQLASIDAARQASRAAEDAAKAVKAAKPAAKKTKAQPKPVTKPTTKKVRAAAH